MKQFLRLLALFLPLFVPLSAAAEVNIAASCRVKNSPPGRCGWCAVETLARHLELKRLQDITRAHAERTTPDDLEGAVSDAGVVYRIQRPGDLDSSMLSDAIGAGLGAVVGFRELYPGAGGHIVTLVDITSDVVRLIDPNDRDGRTRTMPLERFLYWWDGFALVLEREATAE